MTRSFTLALCLLCLAANAAFASKETATAALNAEPKVKDLMWRGSTLYVGVLDDGSNRFGYALYVCNVLAEHDLRGMTVHVMDIVKIVRDNDWVKLGSADCDREFRR